uniref:Wsv262 n=1 Tax=White spot syndrome virus TaxID=92652 RepID=A0A2U9GBF0_WSSV|nr:wsv262 [Shrimp white spot syndrome virus]
MFLSYQRTDQLLSVYLYADTPLDASPTHSTCPLSSSLLSCSLPELRLLRIVCTSSLQRRRMRMKMRRIRDLICKAASTTQYLSMWTILLSFLWVPLHTNLQWWR